LVRVRNGVSASFQIIPRPVGRLGLALGSEPHVVGRLESGPQVGAGFYLRGIFGRGLSPGGVVSRGVSPRFVPDTNVVLCFIHVQLNDDNS